RGGVGAVARRGEAGWAGGGVKGQGVATRCQTQTAAAPFDEVDGKRLAQRLDLEADGRLAGSQLARGLREASGAGHGEERLELPVRDHWPETMTLFGLFCLALWSSAGKTDGRPRPAKHSDGPVKGTEAVRGPHRDAGSVWPPSASWPSGPS